MRTLFARRLQRQLIELATEALYSEQFDMGAIVTRLSRNQPGVPLLRAYVAVQTAAQLTEPLTDADVDTPIAFEIQRIGQKTERISAEAVQTEGTLPKYVFRRKGKVVFDIFVQALEREPKPMYPQTPKAKAAWKAFVQRHDAVNRVSYLER